MPSIEIIVARYNEDLKWTNEDVFNEYKYTIYNKGDNDEFEKINVNKVINVKNVGRCDHTYLYHIITNYNSLADITVFFPGSLDLDYKKRRAIEILQRIKNGNAIFIGEYSENIKNKFNDFQLDNWQSTNLQNVTKNNEKKLQLSDIRPFGNWYKYYFGNKNATFFCYWGIFSIDKRDIIQHPVYRYIILIQQINKSSNPEVGHYLERSWTAVFFPMKYTKFINKPYK
jgi:hypothetical protein